MPCTTGATDPTATSPRALASLATSWAATTRTVTLRSTTPLSVSRSRGHCATHSCRGRATSAPRATTRPRPSATPSAVWRHLPWRWCGISMRTPSTSGQTTTAAPRSPGCCRPDSPTSSSMAAPASPWGWQRTFPRTTSARLPRVRSGCWRIQTLIVRPGRRRSPASSRAPTSRPARSLSDARASTTISAPGVVRSRCAPSSRLMRTPAAGRFWSSPNSHTRSTPTICSCASPNSSVRENSPESPISAMTPRPVPA